MRERFEQQSGSLVGLHHLEVYQGERPGDPAVDPCAPVLAGGPPIEFTATLSTVPGHFVISCYPLPEAGGAVHVVRDITRQRQLEEQLRQSQKMHAIGQLAGGVAHDFNNLLTVISSSSELALLDLPESAGGVREDLREIRRAADRAALLTRQLLLFGRKGVWEERYVDVNELVKGSSRMLGRLLGEDVIITVTARVAVAGTRGDPSQLEQVVLNLALNARDAMPNGGRLLIETDAVHLPDHAAELDPEARPGRYVTLRVTDTGTGISPEVRAHLFEPFFTTKGPGKGTGLGLSTVYGIVQQAAGFITVDSELGAGSTFTVYLPAATPSTEAAPSLAPNGRGATGNETILVVEDETSVRSVTVRSLQSHGFRVLEVGTAAEALELIEGDVHREIALLLTDVIMPMMGGRELADRARVIRPGLPVMFISGYSAEQVTRQGLFAAGDRLLQKPFTAVSLTTAVREAIDARR